MNKPWIKVVALVLAGALGWFAYAAIRAHRNLVTLDVREMPVREVISKIEWQTWEIIIVQTNVEGKITLNVKGVPLDEVLEIISEQVSCRWTTYYPLYTSSKSLAAFKRAVRGEANPLDVGWTNLASRSFRLRGGGGPGGPGGPGGGGPGGGGFGGGPGGGGPGGFGGGGGGFGGDFADNLREGGDGSVSVNIVNKDLSIATMALARYGRARIVPEDGTTGNINITLQQAPMDEAIKRLAKQTKRNWTHYYALQGGGGGRDRADFGGRRGGRDDGDGPTQEERDAMREAMRLQAEALVETMSPEERQRMEEQRKQMEEIRNLPPEQRRERFEQMANDPKNQQRRENRMMNQLKNSTPDQRADRAKQMSERMQRRNDPSNTNSGRGGFRGGFRGQ